MREIVIRECTTIEELDKCILLQREVFGLPDLEISPRRHLIVSREAGGWTLGAFHFKTLIGFVHQLVGIRGHDEIIGYSHMMAVAKDYQNRGVGAQLKWAQRARALAEGRKFIKWTWDPMQARNAHFNLNRLGVTVRTYAENFYGSDYVMDPDQRSGAVPGLQSDRLFAHWDLNSERVSALADGRRAAGLGAAAITISIPTNWSSLISTDIAAARREQERVRSSFLKSFAEGLVCAGFERGEDRSQYLLYESDRLD